MKLLFLIFSGFSFNAFADSNLVGTWQFTSIIYQEQVLPLPNPDLDLRFIFYANGHLRLKWSRHNESGFCEKKADYTTLGNILYQKTTWLNPKNHHSCSTDPEMQMSSETYTVFQIHQKKLQLHLNLGDEEIVYVFSFLPLEDEKTGKEMTNLVNGL